VQVEMKGVHKVKRRLAGGGESVHYYAWRGGPKINADYGTAAFLAEWQAHCATREKPQHHAGTFQTIITAYQQASAFTSLAAATREGYQRHIKRIEQEFGDLPIAALSDPPIRGEFLDWRDRLGQTSKRNADYAFSVLARMISWAYDRRQIAANHCERPGRLYSGDRAANIWTDAAIASLTAFAPPHVLLPCMIALRTGQRQRDILRLTWSAYDGKTIKLRQSKTRTSLTIPVSADLRAILDATPRGNSVTICKTSRGTPWTSDGFKSSFATACEKGKITGLTFHDFRGTAVTNLAQSGCTVPEIATITGHSLKDAETILNKHYFSRDNGLAESAIRKLEKHLS
jgi:integrase